MCYCIESHYRPTVGWLHRCMDGVRCNSLLLYLCHSWVGLFRNSGRRCILAIVHNAFSDRIINVSLIKEIRNVMICSYIFIFDAFCYLLAFAGFIFIYNFNICSPSWSGLNLYLFISVYRVLYHVSTFSICVFKFDWINFHKFRLTSWHLWKTVLALTWFPHAKEDQIDKMTIYC